MNKTMKALVKKKKEAGIWMEEVAVPEIGPEELLIKVVKTSICGTDLHIYNWDSWAQRTIPVPMVIGHEFVGTVEQVGSLVNGYKPGDRVSAEGHITCGHCRNCRAGKLHVCRNTVGIGVNRPGCFAEYLSVPAGNAFPISPLITDEVAAILDPYGNAIHSAISFDLVGEDVLITGAGPIGIMSVAVCKHVGARHVVISDVIDYRLELAAKMGATRTVNAKREQPIDVMQELGMAEGFDVGLEMSGSPAGFHSMLNAMNNGGSVALLGIFPEKVEIDWDKVIFKGLTLKGIYGREMFETWYKGTSMLEAGLDISKVITHRMRADDFEAGFAVVQDGKSGKVLLDWS